MKYMVMECHDSYVVLMDETAGFVKAKNMNYQIGDIVTNPVIINNSEKYKKIIFPIMATASTIAACLIIVFSLGIGRGGSGGSVNPKDEVNNGEIIETSDIVNSNHDRVDSVIPFPEDEESTQKGEEDTSKIIEDDTTKEYEEDTNKNTENDTEGPMTSADAKMIALTHAELKAEEVEFTGSNLQDVDERYVYKISFKTKNNPSITYYNYEIDAITGEVISYRSEVFQGVTGEYFGVLSISEIETIALEVIGLNEEAVVFKENKLMYPADAEGEFDYKNPVYLLDIKLLDDDTFVYHMEIDAITGEVLLAEKNYL